MWHEGVSGNVSGLETARTVTHVCSCALLLIGIGHALWWTASNYRKAMTHRHLYINPYCSQALPPTSCKKGCLAVWRYTAPSTWRPVGAGGARSHVMDGTC